MENNKKIGIITFHAADNYGAVLQAYALQTYLTEQGNKVQIIDFVPFGVEKANKPLFVQDKSAIKRMIKKALILPNYFKLKKRNKSFAGFRKEFLYLSDKFRNAKEIKNAPLDYDICITGSDQVFNPLIQNSDIYYLDFCNKASKVAYAPSFGIKDFSLVGDKTRNLIKQFNHLSCREADGAEFLSTVTGNTVPTVSDPVFLLSPDKWNKITTKPRDGKYIFVYDLNGGNNLIAIANKIKVETGLPIVCITARKYSNTGYNVDELHVNSGPLEFVSYIQYADYVVTDSFHGTAFSTLFRRKFISYVALKHAASRIQSLLGRLGIEDRIYYNAEEFDIKKVIFKEYDKELEELVTSSEKYLQGIYK